jgi:hypothetical protein
MLEYLDYLLELVSVFLYSCDLFSYFIGIKSLVLV